MAGMGETVAFSGRTLWASWLPRAASQLKDRCGFTSCAILPQRSSRPRKRCRSASASATELEPSALLGDSLHHCGFSAKCCARGGESARDCGEYTRSATEGRRRSLVSFASLWPSILRGPPRAEVEFRGARETCGATPTAAKPARHRTTA
eukprot:scaffold268_cov236-Pinguiococcus_pyrenoidosus.AAC.21